MNWCKSCTYMGLSQHSMIISKNSQVICTVVQFLSNKNQTTKEREYAVECIDILFNVTKMEHWDGFALARFGTKQNFKKMSNFALPLVILTWQRMLLEHFWRSRQDTFSELGVYSAQQHRVAKISLDNLYLINSNCETQTL
jgi:hypothetical protein